MEILVRLLVATIVLWAVPANALPLNEWKAKMIKLQFGEAEGSGFFMGKPDQEILTSEHVPPPAERKAKLIYAHKGGQGYPTEGWVNVLSYLNGMAVLNRTDSYRDLWLDKQAATISDLKTDREYFAMGFPAGTQELRVIGPGQLIEAESKRALIPGVPSVLEFRNLPVDFGMSGGMILVRVGEDDYRFAGMISHQYLKRESGAASTIQQLSKSGEAMAPIDLTFAIPAPFIGEWYPNAQKYFDWKMVRQLSADNKMELLYGPLKFRLVQAKPGDLEAAGVGGADGSGVGGLSSRESAVIEIGLNAEWVQGRYPPEIKPWFEAVQRHRKLYVVRMVDQQNQVRTLGSLDQFITLWRRDGLQAVFSRGSLENINAKLEQTKINTAKLRRAVWRVRAAELSASVRTWLDKMVEESYLIDNQFLDARALAKFLEPSQDGAWNSLLLADFDAVSDLQGVIMELSK